MHNFTVQELTMTRAEPAQGDFLSDISTPEAVQGSARVIERDSAGRLVFGEELPLIKSEQRATAWGPNEKSFTWNRRSFRIGAMLSREVKSLEQRLSRARARGATPLESANDESLLDKAKRLQKSQQQISADGKVAIITLIPYGQSWFHVSPLRRGTQKGPLGLQNWWQRSAGSLISFKRPSDVMRYVEELYPDTQARFGRPLPWDPFESATDVLTAGFPEVVWPGDFSAFDGQRSRFRSRPNDKSHYCVGLLPETFEVCVREIRNCTAVKDLVEQVRSGNWSGKHRMVRAVSAAARRRNREEVQAEKLEAELHEEGLLEEYAWLAAVKSLAGPPGPEYYVDRGRPVPKPFAYVADYACDIFAQLVGSTDRAIMRNREAGKGAEDDSGMPFVGRLSTGASEPWSLLRKMLKDGSPSQDLIGTTAEHQLGTLFQDIFSKFQMSGSNAQAASMRQVIVKMFRLLVRQGRSDLAGLITQKLDSLLEDEGLGSDAEMLQVLFTWRLYTL